MYLFEARMPEQGTNPRSSTFQTSTFKGVINYQNLRDKGTSEGNSARG